MIERLKTAAKIGAEVIRGRAFADTLLPGKRNHVVFEITRADGTVEVVEGWNSRTDAGAAAQGALMGSVSGNPFNYVALSTSTLPSAAKTDTTLTGEITSATDSGLARAQGTYGSYVTPATYGGSASYQITHTFTSAAGATVNSAALFDASSGGNLFVQATLSNPATLSASDSLKITWQINF